MGMRFYGVVLSVALSVSSTGLFAAEASSHAATLSTNRPVNTARRPLRPAYDASRSSTLFYPNNGTLDRQIRFFSLSPTASTYFTASTIVTSFSGADSSLPSDMLIFSLLDNQHASVLGEGPIAPAHSAAVSMTSGVQTSNHAAAFSQVRMSGAYPGVDIIFSGISSPWSTYGSTPLTYEIAVMKDADPSRLRLKVEGAESMRIGRDGALTISTANGELRWERPVGSQEYLDKPSRTVACSYRIEGDEVRFVIGSYDHNGMLTIRPRGPANIPRHLAKM